MFSKVVVIVRKIWADPVWSKVIAAAIFAGASTIHFAKSPTAALLASSLSLLWLSCFYIYFRKGEARIILSRSTAPLKRFRTAARSVGLVGIVAIPLLTLTGYAVRKYCTSRSSSKFIVLVANFEDTESKSYRVTRIIVEQLANATKQYNEVEIKLLGKSITWEGGTSVALNEGYNTNASIVLWGDFDKTSEKAIVTVHFEVLKKPSTLSLRTESETIKVPISDLERFVIQEQLSKQMSYLTLLVVGLAQYELGDYDKAIALFTDALRQPTIPKEMIDPGVVYFYRGNCYQKKRQFEAAIADFTDAHRLYRDVGDPRKYALALKNLGDVLDDQGNPMEASTAYEKAVAAFREIKDEAGVATTLNNQAYTLINQGDLSRAKKMFEESMAISGKTGDRVGEAMAMNGIANTLWRQGKLSNAEGAYRQALAYFRETSDRSGTATVTNSALVPSGDTNS